MILHKFNQKGYDAYKKLIEDISTKTNTFNTPKSEHPNDAGIYDADYTVVNDPKKDSK